jgi:hypothetical protein
MRNIIPVLAWMLVILALPHGTFENVAMVGLLATGAIGLYRTFKKPDTWERRIQKELRKAGIKSGIRKLPNGRTLADVLEELASQEETDR